MNTDSFARLKSLRTRKETWKGRNHEAGRSTGPRVILMLEVDRLMFWMQFSRYSAVPQRCVVDDEVRAYVNARCDRQAVVRIQKRVICSQAV